MYKSSDILRARPHSSLAHPSSVRLRFARAVKPNGRESDNKFLCVPTVAESLSHSDNSGRGGFAYWRSRYCEVVLGRTKSTMLWGGKLRQQLESGEDTQT